MKFNLVVVVVVVSTMKPYETLSASVSARVQYFVRVA